MANTDTFQGYYALTLSGGIYSIDGAYVASQSVVADNDLNGSAAAGDAIDVASANTGTDATPVFSSVDSGIFVGVQQTGVVITDSNGDHFLYTNDTTLADQLQVVVDTTTPYEFDRANSPYTGTVLVTGTERQGETLTATIYNESDADGLGGSATTAYQWMRDGVAISGATSSTYTLSNDDVDAVITVEVTVTDDQGSENDPIVSAATGPIENINDPATASAALDVIGIATEGETLEVDPAISFKVSDADGMTNATITYQWMRDGVDIAGATSDTYTLTNDDVGTAISYKIMFTDDQGTDEEITSAATANVGGNAPFTALVLVNGVEREGQPLTATYHNQDDDDGLTINTPTWQWMRDGVAIAGATSDTYTLTQDDVGAVITAELSWVDDSNNPAGTATSAGTGPIENVNQAASGSVTLVGIATEGETLSIDSSSMLTISDTDGTDNATYTYQWTRGGVDIDGATGATYTTGHDDVGAAIAVKVMFTDDQGTDEEVVSAATANIAAVNSAPEGAVVIDGILLEGEVLTANTDGVTDADGMENATLQYRWFADGTAVSGNWSTSNDTYTLAAADVGKEITVSVRYRDDEGNAVTVNTITSDPSEPVGNVNSPMTATIAMSGILAEGETLTISQANIATSVSDADGVVSSSIEIHWLRDGEVIVDANGDPIQVDNYTLTQEDVGASISIRVTHTDSLGSTETFESIATAPVANVDNATTVSVTLAGTATEGQTMSAVPVITDLDGVDVGSITYQWMKDGVAISGATGATYTLSQDDVGGAISVSIAYSDGQGNAGTATSASSAPVVNVNEAPVAADKASSTAYETAATFTVATLLAGATDADGDTLTVTGVSGALNGTVSLSNGVVTFTPTAGFSGNARFDFTVSDGNGGTDTGTMVIAVAEEVVTPVDPTPVDPEPVDPEPAPNPVLDENANTWTGTDAGEVAQGLGGNDNLSGGGGNDTLAGNAGDDTVNGGDGDDNLSGAAGNDNIDGGAGNDMIGGGAGEDTINGGADNDTIGSGLDDDVVNGDDGDYRIAAGAGNDDVSGGSGNDNIGGSTGDDTIDGDDGNDNIGGGYGADVIDAGAGDDTVGAGQQDDVVNGGAGNDSLNGNNGDDVINGGAGDDTINGGDHNDTMTGGDGADVFYFRVFNSGSEDRITDFTSGEDMIQMQGNFAGLTITDHADGVQIEKNGHVIILEGVDEVTADDFTFI